MDNPPNDGPCEVIITAPDQEWLQKFVADLIDDRLAAAAHVDLMRTTYRWSGTVERKQEARATLHTSRRHLRDIEARTAAEHPYRVPCLIAKNIDWGNADYLAWLHVDGEAQVSGVSTSVRRVEDEQC